MRIEGAIMAASMVSQQTVQPDTQIQRDRAYQATASNLAQEEARQGDDSRAVGRQMLESAIGQVEKILNAFDESVAFKIHEQTKSTIVSVVNRDTGEVIREYPSEKFLDLVAMFQKQLSGLFVDTNR
ncbi:MAG: flagellar protein FlaG [bacterium]|nr:flagellar protein FlaG [bacterium]